jgi:hypothetical protein
MAEFVPQSPSGRPNGRTELLPQASQASQALPATLTVDWVERHLIPILRELSRTGVKIIYESGIEPVSRGS